MAKKRQTRADRWIEAATRLREAAEDLYSVWEEYQQWHDSLPENLQQSGTGEKLERLMEFDVDGIVSEAGEMESADLPMGFGRD